MNGMRHTHIQQIGHWYIKLGVIILICVLFFSSCSSYWLVGDGRGDWDYEIYEGYCIDKINSRQILLTHRNNPEDSGGTIIISKYFVTNYQLQEPYILVEGINTQSNSISDEELNNSVLTYYIVDTINGEVVGPLASYVELEEQCSVLSIDIDSEWNKPSNPNK